ncbi:MAG: hypothetical protein HDS92_00140 [Bacteroidales bacterium]|nr:hypothetical protein [Bacteroidales bacterium]
MMKPIKYDLRGVTVEQFATLFEPTSVENPAINVSVPVKTNYEERSFAVGVNVQFQENGVTFLVAEAYCHYEIERECWEELSESGTKDVILPKDFMDCMIRIGIGTLRGVICAKTENTPFAKFYLPIIEVDNQEGEDFVFSKQ